MTDQQKFPQLAAFLRDRIADIQSKNPRVSIRSICIRAGISSGRMTDLLNGRRALSEYYAEKLVFGLKLHRQERDDLYSFITVHSRKAPQRRLQTESQFSEIVGWENYAILNILKTQNHIPTAAWIAERLSIAPDLVAQSLESLFQRGLIKKTGDGFEWVSDYITSSWEFSNESQQESHHQVLDKSIETLHKTAPHLRDYSSLTLAIDMEKMEIAKKLIGEFRKKFGRQFEAGPKSEVYNLSIQFFPLTRPKD